MPLGRNVLAYEFWSRVATLVQQGYDSTLAWLTLFLELIGPDKPLGELKTADLQTFGQALDVDAFPGVTEFFDDVRAAAREADKDAQVEFYIVSGGLKEIVTRRSNTAVSPGRT